MTTAGGVRGILGEGTVTKYEAVATKLAEFAVVTGTLYVVGRLVLTPLVFCALSKREVEKTSEVALEKVVRGPVVAFAVIFGIAADGFGGALRASAVVVAAATLAAGFAACDVISNFVAGVFIVHDDNFNMDD